MKIQYYFLPCLLVLHSTTAAELEDGLDLNFLASASAKADVEGDEELATSRFQVAVDYSTERTVGEGSIRVGGFYEFSKYDFDNQSTEDVDIYGVRLTYEQVSGEKYGWFFVGGANFANGESAKFDDGITGFGAGGAVFVLSEDLSVRLGVGGMTSIEDSGFFFPVIAIDWAISDRLNLKTLDGIFVNRHNIVHLSYDLTGDQGTVVDASIRYERRDVATDDDESEAFLETSFISSVGVRQRIGESFFVRAYAGLETDHEIETFRSSSSLETVEIDDAAIIGLEATFTF